MRAVWNCWHKYVVRVFGHENGKGGRARGEGRSLLSKPYGRVPAIYGGGTPRIDTLLFDDFRRRAIAWQLSAFRRGRRPGASRLSTANFAGYVPFFRQKLVVLIDHNTNVRATVERDGHREMPMSKTERSTAGNTQQSIFPTYMHILFSCVYKTEQNGTHLAAPAFELPQQACNYQV